MARKLVEQRTISLPSLPAGSESSLGVVDLFYDDGSVKRLWTKDDGVQVLGFTSEGTAITITEHGYTHLVGGHIKPGEGPEHAACRELVEETGYAPGSLELLASFYQDSGGSERVIWLYLATDCHRLHAGEVGISVTLMTPNELWQHITYYKPGTKQKGLMSLTLAALAFQKLGFLTFTTPQKRKT